MTKRQQQIIPVTTPCQVSLKTLEREIFEHLNTYEEAIWAYAQLKHPTRKDQDLLNVARQEFRSHIAQVFKRAATDETAKNALDITFKAYASAAEKRFEKIEFLEPGFIALVDSMDMTVERTR